MASIVVADNDPEALSLALMDLRLEGHAVMGARDGAMALDMIRRSSPEVVVLDYRMPPGLTGMSVAVHLRAQYPEMVIVLWTNYGDSELIGEARKAGIVFLPKGDLRRLRAAVSS